MYRQTSLDAYASVQGNINYRQRQVLDALEEIFPACNRQISVHSGLPINVVTPRMNELAKKNKVTQAYEGKDPVTGRKAIFWKPV